MKPLIEQIILISAISTVLLVFISSCVMPGCIMPGCIQGSGNNTIENRTVDDFSSINLAGIGDVYLAQGEKHLRIEAEDNIIQDMKTDVSGGKLTIHQRTDCINPHEPIKIFISTPELESISISGLGRVISLSPIKSDALSLGMSGSGSMELNILCQDLRTTISGSGGAILRGVAKDSDIMISGTGAMHGYGLMTDRSNVTISGSGMAQVNAMDELNALISGRGSVYYKGNPRNVSQMVSGSGKVIAFEG